MPIENFCADDLRRLIKINVGLLGSAYMTQAQTGDELGGLDRASIRLRSWPPPLSKINHRSASELEVQLTLSTRLIGFAFGQVTCGPISGRFGRKFRPPTGLAASRCC